MNDKALVEKIKKDIEETFKRTTKKELIEIIRKMNVESVKMNEKLMVLERLYMSQKFLRQFETRVKHFEYNARDQMQMVKKYEKRLIRLEKDPELLRLIKR